MNYSCESFIEFCDQMMIPAEEGLIKNFYENRILAPKSSIIAFEELSTLIGYEKKRIVDSIKNGEDIELDLNQIKTSDGYRVLFNGKVNIMSGTMGKIKKSVIENFMNTSNKLKNTALSLLKDPNYEYPNGANSLIVLCDIQIKACDTILSYKGIYKNGFLRRK